LEKREHRWRALGCGAGAGLLLGFVDWFACGLAATPGSLALASLGLGLAGGCAAGALAAVLGRPALASGLVLAAGIALEGLSIASKELAGTGQLVAAAAVMLLAGLALLGLLRDDLGARWPGLAALATLPAAGWLAAFLTEAPLAGVAACAAPLAWIALARRARPAVLGAALLAPLAVLLVAQRAPASPAHRAPPPATATSAGPSVVLLVIDTLRADALDPAGALASFAREGVEFRQCVSAAPWTLPAVSSLLTGLWPSQHGAVTAATPLAEEITTLAELLHASGYATGAFTGGAFVGEAHRLDQGFEAFEAGCERRFANFPLRQPLVWRLAKNRHFPLRPLVRAVDESVGLAGVLSAARAWAEGETQRPKFLFLHTYQVHDYYLYDPDLDDAVLAAGPSASARFAGRLSVPPSELVTADQADLDHFRALYQGRVRAVEELFPSLVDALEPLVGADALWIVTADHGEGFDAASGRVHHGGRLHEDLLRVPLFLRMPGRLAPGQVVEPSVRSVDVLPTVLALLGLPVPSGLAGESLLPALSGERPYPATAFAEELAHGYGLFALRQAGWKWIRAPGHEELYRLDEDPAEKAPLSRPVPEELRAEARTFAERFPPRRTVEVELDDATLQQLHALGYVH